MIRKTRLRIKNVSCTTVKNQKPCIKNHAFIPQMVAAAHSSSTGQTGHTSCIGHIDHSGHTAPLGGPSGGKH